MSFRCGNCGGVQEHGQQPYRVPVEWQRMVVPVSGHPKDNRMATLTQIKKEMDLCGGCAGEAETE